MADIIHVNTAKSMSLDEFVDACASTSNLEQESGLLSLAPAMRRLANNKAALIQALHVRLRAGLEPTADFAYIASVLLAVGPRFVVRLNAWQRPRPFERREAFAFDVAHNHDFDFLTVGYHGPGYATDLWTLDTKGFSGYAGEPVKLAPQPRAVLSEGVVMYYRRHVDVHVQLDPAAFSMSLNLIPKSTSGLGSGFEEQYEFDVKRSVVRRVLPGLATRQADLLEIASAIGNAETDQLIEELFHCSPNRRTRIEGRSQV